ncbi:MAG: hypothetical protein ACRERD_12220, partial [Candidatus Binatia bacterium]
CTSALLYSRQLRRRYLALVFLCFTSQDYRQIVSVTISATKPIQYPLSPPDEAPPPVELSAKHFSDWTLALHYLPPGER